MPLASSLTPGASGTTRSDTAGRAEDGADDVGTEGAAAVGEAVGVAGADDAAGATGSVAPAAPFAPVQPAAPAISSSAAISALRARAIDSPFRSGSPDPRRARYPDGAGRIEG